MVQPGALARAGCRGHGVCGHVRAAKVGLPAAGTPPQPKGLTFTHISGSDAIMPDRGRCFFRPEGPADSGRGRIWPAHFSEAGEAGKTEPTETHHDQKFPPDAGGPGVPAPRRGCAH